MADVVRDGEVVSAGRVRSTDPSTSELVQRATEQLSRLVRDELALARAELAEKGKHAGIGVGLFGGSGVLAFFGTGMLVATVVLLLAEVMPAWASAAIVTAALLVAAGTLALLGRRQLGRATPAKPEAAVRSVREDVTAVTTAVARGVGRERTK